MAQMAAAMLDACEPEAEDDAGGNTGGGGGEEGVEGACGAPPRLELGVVQVYNEATTDLLSEDAAPTDVQARARRARHRPRLPLVLASCRPGAPRGH